MNAREALVNEIAAVRERLAALEKALGLLDENAHRELAGSGDPSMRFYGKRPLDAIRALYAEPGQKPLTQEELTKKLLEGGIAIGKKRKHHNVRISIETNLENGNLIRNEDNTISVNASDDL